MKAVLQIVATIALALVLTKVIYLFPWFEALMNSQRGQSLHVWLATVFHAEGAEQAENMWMAIWFVFSLIVSALLVFCLPRRKA
ncbi:hypothetical protein DF052_26555 [Burkholderia glumae]|uniref:hypothetical protein n=1 Tax=Burkholderia glumae TaxID=337 RepID=UPI000F6040A3|nr:hypothetical protein [Burkholderia glumae]RQZ65527.1 hypothetical protein DF052_26555 [Burkholderia glumae]